MNVRRLQSGSFADFETKEATQQGWPKSLLQEPVLF